MSETPLQRPDHIPIKNAPETKHIPDDVWEALQKLDRARTEQLLNAEPETEAEQAPVENGK